MKTLLTKKIYNRKINPFIRSAEKVIPIEHQAKLITLINDSSAPVISNLIQAFLVENEPGLKKLLVLKLMELLEVSDVSALINQLDKINTPKVNSQDFQQALTWHIKY